MIIRSYTKTKRTIRRSRRLARAANQYVVFGTTQRGVELSAFTA